MYFSTRSAFVAVALLLAAACSDGAGAPPLVDYGVGKDAPAVARGVPDAGTVAVHTALSDASSVDVAVPTTEPCNDEGTTADCMAPIGGENAGYVLCAPGEKICRSGFWTTCGTQATSAPISGWEPATVGCNAAPEACATQGAVRPCTKQLPPTSASANCYHGTQTCSEGYWGACVP